MTSTCFWQFFNPLHSFVRQMIPQTILLFCKLREFFDHRLPPYAQTSFMEVASARLTDMTDDTYACGTTRERVYIP